MAARLAARVAIGGSALAEASGVTSTVAGHLKADSHMTARVGGAGDQDLAAISAAANADAGLQTAGCAIMGGPCKHRHSRRAKVDADADDSASMGKQGGAVFALKW